MPSRSFPSPDNGPVHSAIPEPSPFRHPATYVAATLHKKAADFSSSANQHAATFCPCAAIRICGFWQIGRPFLSSCCFPVAFRGGRELAGDDPLVTDVASLLRKFRQSLAARSCYPSRISLSIWRAERRRCCPPSGTTMKISMAAGFPERGGFRRLTHFAS